MDDPANQQLLLKGVAALLFVFVFPAFSAGLHLALVINRAPIVYFQSAWLRGGAEFSRRWQLPVLTPPPGWRTGSGSGSGAVAGGSGVGLLGSMFVRSANKKVDVPVRVPVRATSGGK